MKNRLHTFLLRILNLLLLPFYLLYLLGKTLFWKLRDGGPREEFLPVGGYLTAACFSDHRRLGGFLNSYYEIRTAFQKTNGHKYTEYTRKILANLFEFYPAAHSNDICADNLNELTVHHVKPQSQIKNDPAAMTDLGNLAPCTRATHDKADAGARLESIQGTKQRYTFRFLAASFFGLITSSFLLGFLSELFFRLFDSIRKRHFSKPKELLAASARAGLSVLLLSLPITLLSCLLASVSERIHTLNLVLQIVFSLVLLFHSIIGIVQQIGERMTATALCLLPVHAIFLFGIGTAVNSWLSAAIVYPFLKDLAASAILSFVFALDRALLGGLKGKAANLPEGEEDETESLPPTDAT